MPRLSKRAVLIQRMHEQGMTYEQIGAVFNISKQAAHQASMANDALHEGLIQKIPYVGLKKWLLDNRVSVKVLSEMCGSAPLYKSLTGECNPRKKTIDAVLKVTGLTYEECFKEDEV